MTIPLNFAITIISTDEETLVQVVGEIDSAVSAKLQERLATAAGGGLPVIVDLSEVTFCDSSGLTALIQGRTAAETAGTQFVVVTEQRAVVRPIALLGLTALLRVQPDLAAARAVISSSGQA